MNKRTFLILTLSLTWLCQAMLWNVAVARLKADVKPDQNVRHEGAAIVPAGEGDVIVIWRAVVQQGSDIYAQKLHRDGKQIWRNGGVEICHQSIADAHFSAVTDSQGGVIIVWEDSREGKYNTDIYAQRLDEYGKPMWRSTGVPVCTARHQQLFPKVVVDQRGGAYVFWIDYRNGNADVFGCHVDRSGEIVHRFAVCTENQDQMDLTAAAASTGGACILWVDHRYDGPGIYGESIDATDSMRWEKNGLPICTGSYQQESPSVVALRDGRFLITWADYRNRVAKVFLQLVGADGKEVPPLNGMCVTDSDGPQYGPSLCLVDSSMAAVTWLQYGKGARMFQQHVELSGALKIKPEVGISKPSLAQFWANTAPDGKGGVVAVWLAYVGDRAEVFAQLTASSNRLQWGKAGLLLGPAAEGTHPKIVRGQTGGFFFAAWTADSENGSRITVIGLTDRGKKIWERQL